jgi:serine/threonine protein kinase
MRIDDHVLRVVEFRFPDKVRNAVEYKSYNLALDAYTAAERIPSNTTVGDFQAVGYLMNGPLYEGSALTTCFKDKKMYIMKGLDPKEYTRAQQFLSAFGNSYPPHIVTFELSMSSHGKPFMIMPAMRYPIDKVPSPYFAPDSTDVLLLWTHMESALTHIHSGNYAFMDIKPPNICYDDDGYYLIDLGSIVPFNSNTSSTEAYIPSDLTEHTARAEIDWWMLGVTLAEIGCGNNGLPVSSGNRRFSRQEIIIQLETYLPGPVYFAFQSKVNNL